jgi:aspartyl-tRNA synthetase
VKQPPRANAYRDAWCGELTAQRAGSTARVAGWVHRRRDHGGLIFIDLRDRSGLVQLVFHPETSGETFATAEQLRPEHVVSAFGEVVPREPGNVNPNLATGEIEISVTELAHLASADTPPFAVDEEGPVDESTRLRHRVVDLRRELMRDALLLRDAVTGAMRAELAERDFAEIETPMLTRSTPEGARDFLVPSRLQPGSFYALPQSPQIFKQLLMISGFERYFQIVRCFRDEDLRADRQPEFTQLDVEMSFVDEEDVIEMMEAVMSRVFAAGAFDVAPAPWPRMGYDEAMARFGTDRPDLRIGLEIRDVTEALSGTEFRAFQADAVRVLNVGQREAPRSELDRLTELAKQHGAAGLVWAFVADDRSWRSPVAKFLTEAEIAAFGGEPGDLLLAVAGSPQVAAAALGALRLELGEPEAGHRPLWVVDFPMFERGEDGAWTALHHPFTAPTGDLGDPASLRSRAYDLVVDGWELGGGSVRINTLEVQREVFKIIGLSEEEAQRRFGFLLDALRYGAPPHGGIAMGLDRIVAIIAGRDSIRDVIAFPKTASGADPLTGAPSPVDAQQLRELGLRPA